MHGPILKQVVVITSDLDVVEKAEYDRVVRSLQQEGITLNVVLVQKGARMGRAILRELAAINGRAYQEPFVALTAELFAKETGGLIVKTAPGEVPRAVQGLLQTLDKGYVAAFTPPPGMTPNQRHKITVTLATPGNQVQLTYRQSFYYPASDAPMRSRSPSATEPMPIDSRTGGATKSS